MSNVQVNSLKNTPYRFDFLCPANNQTTPCMEKLFYYSKAYILELYNQAAVTQGFRYIICYFWFEKYMYT